jgi:hypothetical protein
MNRNEKTYVLQTGGTIALYVLVLFISVQLMRGLGESPWKILAALLPIIPISMGLVTFLHFFKKMDELQKRIQLDALAFSFGATGLLTLTYGLLQNVGLPQISFIVVFPIMLALWGLGYFIAARRYE